MEQGVCHRKRCRRWNTPGHAHEFTFSCYHRQPFLSSERICQWFADAVNCAATRHQFRVWAYVLMPEHVHLLVWPGEHEYSVSAFLKSVKQSVARRVLIWLRRENPSGLAPLATGRTNPKYLFWLEGGGYDRNIHDRETLRTAIDYIHANPVRRGLVLRPAEWQWSSWADWHAGRHGTIVIDRQSCSEALR